MRCFYDLHIHSALSPCAQEEMTPNNIVNMAVLKGLQVIAVCDHNATHNLPAVMAAARDLDLIVVPGIELNTAEEVHLLAYFETLDAACAFGDMVYAALPEFPNRPDFFGEQQILNEQDEQIGTLEKLLIQALPFDISECVRRIAAFGGVAVPAHVNKDANSILANLGFFPRDIQFKTIEVAEHLPVLGNISGFAEIHNSDAHQLADISEPVHALMPEEYSVAGVLRLLGGGKNILD